jgi:hypothetical protein
LELRGDLVRRVKVALQLDLVSEAAVGRGHVASPFAGLEPHEHVSVRAGTRLASAKMLARPAGGVWMIEYHNITPGSSRARARNTSRKAPAAPPTARPLAEPSSSRASTATAPTQAQPKRDTDMEVPSGCGSIRRSAGAISISAKSTRTIVPTKTQRQPKALATRASSPGPKRAGV